MLWVDLLGAAPTCYAPKESGNGQETDETGEEFVFFIQVVANRIFSPVSSVSLTVPADT
jgi:hypothetical protein